MEEKKELLIRLGFSLYQIGNKVETARRRLKDLVEKGVSYASTELLAVVDELKIIDAQWKSLEGQYLELKDEIAGNNLE